jgi:hypothetical protein
MQSTCMEVWGHTQPGRPSLSSRMALSQKQGSEYCDQILLEREDAQVREDTHLPLCGPLWHPPATDGLEDQESPSFGVREDVHLLGL